MLKKILASTLAVAMISSMALSASATVASDGTYGGFELATTVNVPTFDMGLPTFTADSIKLNPYAAIGSQVVSPEFSFINYGTAAVSISMKDYQVQATTKAAANADAFANSTHLVATEALATTAPANAVDKAVYLWMQPGEKLAKFDDAAAAAQWPATPRIPEFVFANSTTAKVHVGFTGGVPTFASITGTGAVYKTSAPVANVAKLGEVARFINDAGAQLNWMKGENVLKVKFRGAMNSAASWEVTDGIGVIPTFEFKLLQQRTGATAPVEALATKTAATALISAVNSTFSQAAVNLTFLKAPNVGETVYIVKATTPAIKMNDIVNETVGGNLAIGATCVKLVGDGRTVTIAAGGLDIAADYVVVVAIGGKVDSVSAMKVNVTA